MEKRAQTPISPFTRHAAAKLRQVLPQMLRDNPSLRTQLRDRIRAVREEDPQGNLVPQTSTDAYQVYAPVMEAIFTGQDTRQGFVTRAYQTMRQSNNSPEDTETEQVIQTDVLVIGAGPNGIAAALSAKRAHPDWKVTIIDSRDHLGGPFGTATYTLNTPNNPRRTAVFDGEDLDHPNTLGSDALLQLTSFAPLWPVSDDVHDGLVGNAQFADSVRLQTRAHGWQVDENKRVTVFATDTKTEQPVRIDNARIVLYAPGMGKQGYGKINIEDPETAKTLTSRADRIYSTETWMTALEEMSQEDAVRLVQQGLTFIGGNDSVKMTMAKLIEKLDAKTLATEHIRLIGTKYTTQDEYQRLTFMPMPTYRSLHRFFPTHLDDRNAFILPTQDRVIGLKEEPDGNVGIVVQSPDTGKAHEETAHTIVCATGYENHAMDLLTDFVPSGNMQDLEVLYADFPDAPSVVIGRKVPGLPIYLVGAGADIEPSSREQKNGRTQRATLRRIVPRSSRLAQQVVTETAAQNAA